VAYQTKGSDSVINVPRVAAHVCAGISPGWFSGLARALAGQRPNFTEGIR
jgi:hypothetical protein